jgi:hypothetical protein
MRVLMAALAGALLTVAAGSGTAGAGPIGVAVDGPSAPALSLAVSQAVFKPASTNDVVVVDERRAPPSRG